MSDQPFYAPNHTTAPRQPRAGEHLWTIEKHSRQLACELRDDGAAGVELQVSRDGELLYGRRLANRALALAEAETRKAQYLRAGGVLTRVTDRRRTTMNGRPNQDDIKECPRCNPTDDAFQPRDCDEHQRPDHTSRTASGAHRRPRVALRRVWPA